MVLLVTTDRILAALEAVPASRRTELGLPATLDLAGPIAHEQLLRLAKHLQHDGAEYNTSQDHDCSRDASPTILSSLLRGTKVYVPPPPKKPEPSPEYLASKARLLAAEQQAAYQRLLNPTSTPNLDTTNSHAAEIIPEDTLTPSLVINIFLSVLITGFSVYWALTLFTMPEILATMFASWTGPRDVDGAGAGAGASAAVRVLLSLFAALAVAVAESFLYAAYLGKVERARVKERGMRERKEVVGAVGDDGVVGAAEERDSEEVAIWGKGVNGGVRRRVREKWEKEKEHGEEHTMYDGVSR